MKEYLNSQLPPKLSPATASSSHGRFVSVDLPTRHTPVPQSHGSQGTQSKLSRTKVSNKHHDSAKASVRPSPVRQSTPPRLKSPLSPATPSQANIEVVIPLIKQWTARPPKSDATLRAEREILLNDLKASAEHAKKRPDDVYRLIGQTGFSKNFSTDQDLTARGKLASKKKKKPQATADRQLDISDKLTKSFDHLIVSNVSTITPEKSTRVLLTNRFNEKVNPPLTFANNVNEQLLNGKFQFTDRYIIRPGIKIAPASTNLGCACVGSCALESCSCFTRKVTDADGKNLAPIGQRQTYFRRPDGISVLTNEYIAQELDPAAQYFEITECNEFCSCGQDCSNRVVSKGRTVPLEVFQTAKCGFGVRSSVDIVKGQFIELYLGEVITEAELERREASADEGQPSYIYSLDWFTGVDNRGYHVDGEFFGTAMRFVNHSCAPNARNFTVTTHKRDEKLYYLAFFAIENIPKGVEIRIDYHGGGRDVTGDYNEALPSASQGQAEPTTESVLVRCHCGSKNCRKTLWNPTKAKRGRRNKRLE